MASVLQINNDAAERALNHAGLDITGIDSTSLQAVQDAVHDALYEGWTDARLARTIRRVVGLSKRDAAAVAAFQAGLVARGATLKSATRQADAYAARLRKRRAEVIAHHEVRKALADAQRETWADEQAKGLLTPWAVRVFRVHKDERLCKVCRPLNGRRISLRADDPAPPLHPNCRCWEELKDEGVIKGDTRVTDEVVRKELVAKGVRRVATPAGSRHFDLPIGAPITNKPKPKAVSFNDIGATWRNNERTAQAKARFEALKSDAMVVVYHGTQSAEHAKSLREGMTVSVPKGHRSDLPTMAKDHLYVAPTYDDAANYGEYVVELIVPKGDLAPSPEALRSNPKVTLTTALFNSFDGAVLKPGTKVLVSKAAVRRVRTAAGVRRYGLPLKSPIVARPRGGGRRPGQTFQAIIGDLTDEEVATDDLILRKMQSLGIDVGDAFSVRESKSDGTEAVRWGRRSLLKPSTGRANFLPTYQYKELRRMFQSGKILTIEKVRPEDIPDYPHQYDYYAPSGGVFRQDAIAMLHGTMPVSYLARGHTLLTEWNDEIETVATPIGPYRGEDVGQNVQATVSRIQSAILDLGFNHRDSDENAVIVLRKKESENVVGRMAVRTGGEYLMAAPLTGYGMESMARHMLARNDDEYMLTVAYNDDYLDDSTFMERVLTLIEQKRMMREESDDEEDDEYSGGEDPADHDAYGFTFRRTSWGDIELTDEDANELQEAFDFAITTEDADQAWWDAEVERLTAEYPEADPDTITYQAEANFRMKHNGRSASEPKTMRTDNISIDYSDYSRIIEIEGDVVDDDDNRIGNFNRQLNLEDGTVYNSYFSIGNQHRDNGFARALNQQMFDFYTSRGFTKVHLSANIDVGGYAWARQGFDWHNTPWNVSDMVRDLTHSKNPDLAAEAKTMLDRLQDPLDHVSAYEISELGRDLWLAGKIDTDTDIPTGVEASFRIVDEYDGTVYSYVRKFWPGKNILLGSSWHGEIELTDYSDARRSYGDKWKEGMKAKRVKKDDVSLTGAELYVLHALWEEMCLPHIEAHDPHPNLPDDSVYNLHTVDVDATPDMEQLWDALVGGKVTLTKSALPRDADADGWIYEGTPRKRPAPPRPRPPYYADVMEERSKIEEPVTRLDKIPYKLGDHPPVDRQKPRYNRAIERIDAVYDNYVEEAVNEGDEPMTKEEFRDAVIQSMRSTVASADFSVRMPSHVLQYVLEDGRLKTQFETGRSMGDFAPEYRRDIESMWGPPKPSDDDEDADVFDDRLRPVYGYLSNSDEFYDEGSQHYGDIELVLDKKRMKDRTTFTIGDSFGTQYALPISEVHTADDVRFLAASGDWHAGEFASNATPLITEDYDAGEMLTIADYIEAQYHGGVTLEDIDTIVMHDVDMVKEWDDWQTADPEERESMDNAYLFTLLDASGIKVAEPW